MQTCTEGVLLDNIQTSSRSIAHDMKIEVLSANKISKLKVFDKEYVFSSIRDMDLMGNVYALKLISYVYWIDDEYDSYRNISLTIWSLLAVSGDRLSIQSLIYANNKIK